MQENVMYNNNKKKFQIKTVGTGSTNCQILSSSTLIMNLLFKGFLVIVARGFPYRKNDIKINR